MSPWITTSVRRFELMPTYEWREIPQMVDCYAGTVAGLRRILAAQRHSYLVLTRPTYLKIRWSKLGIQ